MHGLFWLINRFLRFATLSRQDVPWFPASEIRPKGGDIGIAVIIYLQIIQTAKMQDKGSTIGCLRISAIPCYTRSRGKGDEGVLFYIRSLSLLHGVDVKILPIEVNCLHGAQN